MFSQAVSGHTPPAAGAAPAQIIFDQVITPITRPGADHRDTLGAFISRFPDQPLHRCRRGHQLAIRPRGTDWVQQTVGWSGPSRPYGAATRGIVAPVEQARGRELS